MDLSLRVHLRTSERSRPRQWPSTLLRTHADSQQHRLHETFDTRVCRQTGRTILCLTRRQPKRTIFGIKQ
jgi:hypothetical protein